MVARAFGEISGITWFRISPRFAVSALDFGAASFLADVGGETVFEAVGRSCLSLAFCTELTAGSGRLVGGCGEGLAAAGVFGVGFAAGLEADLAMTGGAAGFDVVGCGPLEAAC